MSTTGEPLARAYELIEAERLDEAKTILKPLLESDKNNPDVWWLYAHAVADEDTARVALSNVMRLDKDYPGAVELMKKINEKAGIDDFFGDDLSDDPSFLPSLPSTLPGLPRAGSAGDFDPDFDDDFDLDDDSGIRKSGRAGNRSSSRRRLVIGALLAGIVIIGIVAAFILTRPRSVAPNPTITPLAANVPTSGSATLVPDVSETADPFPSQQVSPVGLDAQIVDGLTASLADFTLAPVDPIGLRATTLGTTLMVTICALPGAEARTALNDAMNIVARQSDAYGGVADAIGIEVVDCDTNNPILVIGAPASAAAEFAAGTFSEREFQGSWRPAG